MLHAPTRRCAYSRCFGSWRGAEEVCERILADFGRADILVNNAGVTRDMLTHANVAGGWDLVLNTV